MRCCQPRALSICSRSFGRERAVPLWRSTRSNRLHFLATRERPMSNRRIACGGFTLVELLIVLAIIGLLVALILPATLGARRRAMVLVSPVTYLGMDGQVHLTGRNGRVDIPVIRNAGNACPYCHTPPAWSPDGLRL